MTGAGSVIATKAPTCRRCRSASAWNGWFSPESAARKAGAATEDFLDAFRIDKGRRVLKGMLRARDSRFFMISDDDDFVSSRIAQFVADHRDANGWIVDDGYVWDDGGEILYRHRHLNHVCGTTLIVRSDLYRLPDTFEAATHDTSRPCSAVIEASANLGRARHSARYVAVPAPSTALGTLVPTAKPRPILKKYVFNRDVFLRPHLSSGTCSGCDG